MVNVVNCRVGAGPGWTGWEQTDVCYVLRLWWKIKQLSSCSRLLLAATIHTQVNIDSYAAGWWIGNLNIYIL